MKITVSKSKQVMANNSIKRTANSACGKKSIKASNAYGECKFYSYTKDGNDLDIDYVDGYCSDSEIKSKVKEMFNRNPDISHIDVEQWSYEPSEDGDYEDYEDVGSFERNDIESACDKKSIKASAVMGAMDTENLTIYVPSYCYVDVLVDSYEQGEGEQVNSWTFQVADGFQSAQELINDIADSSGIFSDDINDYVVLDSSLQTDATVNAENEIPTEEELEAWKRGELELYVAHLWVRLQVGSKTHDMTEDEAEAFGLSVY